MEPRHANGPALDAKRVESSELKVTKPVEVHTKGSPHRHIFVSLKFALCVYIYMCVCVCNYIYICVCV